MNPASLQLFACLSIVHLLSILGTVDAADLFTSGSVWTDQKAFKLTVQERGEESFRATWDLGKHGVREIKGSIRGNLIVWYAKDTTAINGKGGSDNFGTLVGDTIHFVYKDPGTSEERGAFTLKLSGSTAPSATPSSGEAAGHGSMSLRAEVVSVNKIWDQAAHSAFTDLIHFRNAWYCCFRESTGHHGKENGKVRVLTSTDAVDWSSAALVEEAGVDLRDPKFLPLKDGRLALVMGGSIYSGKELKHRQPRVAISADGRVWNPAVPVLKGGEWLWRAISHQAEKGYYGVSYNVSSFAGGEKPESESSISLYSSKDANDWALVTHWNLQGMPTEAAIQVLQDGSMMALVRRDGAARTSMIGVSHPPYASWTWSDSHLIFQGPQFIQLPDGRLVAGGRVRRASADGKVALFQMGKSDLSPLLDLPGGGDCGYPGLVFRDGLLHVSYYSSHEGKAAIYLATVSFGADRLLSQRTDAAATIQTDPGQPRIEVVKDQGPNAAEWVLAALDEAIPADIRQNLALLREDLLDEGAKGAKAGSEAYQLASDYCDRLLAALDQRDLARANAGYVAAQADANKRISNQALDARRNHQMSWPQYAREESQRAALRESEADKADVKKQRLKVEWANRAVQMRGHLDQAYRQFREAMR